MITGSSSLSDCRNCGRMLRGAKEIDYCEKCMIAYEMGRQSEIQKQRQEILDKIDKFEKDNTISIRTEGLVKGKVIISDYIYWGDFRRFKEQLNQPKTEE